MSWSHTKFRARCTSCGKEGIRVDSSNDFGSMETRWDGFGTVPPDEYQSGRMRVGVEGTPVCDCGKSQIEVDKTPMQGS